jgi:hypothetical protein
MTTDKPDLTALADAVERAATNFSRNCNAHNQTAYDMATNAWLAARRAAREAGYVEVLVSREAVEALRLYAETNGLTAVSLPLRLLARDLDALIKEPDHG